MSNYGFTDWQDKLTQQGQPLVNVNNHTALVTENFGPFFVGMHACTGITFIPEGVGTGYNLVLAWFADPAMTVQLRAVQVVVTANTRIDDVYGNFGPYLLVQVVPLAFGGGQQYELVVIPYVVPISREQMLGGQLMVSMVGVIILAGATNTVFSIFINGASAVLSIYATTKNWRAFGSAYDTGLAVHDTFLSVDSGGTLQGITQQVQLPSRSWSLAVTNLDAGAQVFHATIYTKG